jgi:hypothetical protein
MPPPSRCQRVSGLNKHQPQRQKHQHVSNGQDTDAWLPDQSTETSLIGSSADDYTRKLRVLQDQLDKAQTYPRADHNLMTSVLLVFEIIEYDNIICGSIYISFRTSLRGIWMN